MFQISVHWLVLCAHRILMLNGIGTGIFLRPSNLEVPMYRILHDKTTIHYATTKTVADLVAQDLQSRFGGSAKVDATEGKSYHIDFGGMILQSDAPISATCGGFELSFYAHQFQTLLTKVRRGLENIRDGGYVKIHGYTSSLCITTEQVAEFKTFLESNYDELCNLQTSYLSRLAEARAALVNQDILVEDKPDSEIV